METFILTFLLVVIIHNILLYIRNRKTQGTRSTNLQIDSEQNETDTEREVSPASDSRNASEYMKTSESATMTALVSSGESTSCAPYDFDAHPPSSTSLSAPLPPPTLIGSYHEIVHAITRCV
jgi:hypothetical protein